MTLKLFLEGLSRPSLLLLAPTVVVFVFVFAFLVWKRVRSFARPLVPILRLFLLLTLLYVMAGPTHRIETTRPYRHEFFVDLSASLPLDTRRLNFEDIAARIDGLRATRPTDQLRVIAFAGRAMELYSGAAANGPHLAELLASDTDNQRLGLEWMKSDLGRVMHLAAMPRSEGELVDRWIYSDFAMGGPPEDLDKTRTFFVLPSFLPHAKFELTALRGPRRAVLDEAIKFSIEYRSTAAVRGELEISVDREVFKRIPLVLEAGSGEWVFEGDDLRPIAGFHEISARFIVDGADIEPSRVVHGIEVLPQRRVILVESAAADKAASPLARALKAHDLALQTITPPELVATLAQRDEISALIFNGVPAGEIDPESKGGISELVAAGSGLLVFPDQSPGALERWSNHPLGELIPLIGLTPPPPAPEIPEQPEPRDEPPPPRLEDQDPDRSKIEKVAAPTLLLVILIDKSMSMKENNHLRQAQLGAIASARELHPEDRIGVIAFNEQPVEVVPVQPAGNLADIEAAIQRLQADGGTDIDKALKFATEVMSREEAAIKTIVLLSDGYTRPFAVKRAMAAVIERGISVNTIGIGSSFDIGTLTQIAVDGRGTGPIPARTPQEIPRVMVDVASMVMSKNKTRTSKDVKPPKPPRDESIKRPEHLVDTPAPAKSENVSNSQQTDSNSKGLDFGPSRLVTYATGLDWSTAPRIQDVHRTKDKTNSWVALALNDGRPVFAHWVLGDGLVAAAAIPSADGWCEEFELWNGYSTFWAQVVRFLERPRTLSRFSWDGYARPEGLVLNIEDGASRDPARLHDDVEIELVDSTGNVAAAEVSRPRDGILVVEPAAASLGEVARVQIRDRKSRMVVDRLVLPVEPPEELQEPGLDHVRMNQWASTLQAKCLMLGETSPQPAESTQHSVQESGPPYVLLPLLCGLWLLDLMLKRWMRVVPGQIRPVPPSNDDSRSPGLRAIQ